jgi:hypothetical protein
MAPLLAGLCLLLASCGVTEAGSDVVPTTPTVSTATEGEATAAEWADEISVCAAATGDTPGCQWLGGLLIHNGCRLSIYQTLASGLAVGGSFQDLYQDAVDGGDCQEAVADGISE